MPRRAASLVLVLAGTTGCVGPGGLLAPPTPHAAYVAMLYRSGLVTSTDAQGWLRAADAVLEAAVAAAPPFRRTDVLSPASTDARALGYRVTVPRGRRLSIAVAFDDATRRGPSPAPAPAPASASASASAPASAPASPSPSSSPSAAALASSTASAPAPAPLFVDVFRLTSGEPPELVASLPAGRRSLIHDIDEPGDYVVRAQTELGASGLATLAVRTLASLPFPVAGVERGMQSGFGVARDAGRRQHQGIDIFAPRGTPVRAVAGGIARAGTNRLGGTVVWVHAPTAGLAFYYAHLDRHAIGAMAMVEAGDVLGYVGNTGNARTTPPHLHFGIYEGGAIDPWPFVQPNQPVPDQPGPDQPGPDWPGPPPISSRDRPRRRSGRRRPT